MRPSQLLLVPLASLTVCSIGLADVATPRFELRPSAEHVYTGGWEHFVGGGVAAFDCNGDSMPELFAAGGSNSAQLFVNESDPGGLLSFRSATPDSLAITSVIGAYPLDIDNDAILDLVVLRVGENLLLRGQGDCQFEPFADIGFNGGDRWTTAFSATWETGQDLPTLAIGNYVDRDDPDGPFEACDSNELWRPADNRYTDPTILDPGFCALSMLFSDWGRQGRADLRVSNDRHYFVRDGEEQLWAMEAVPRLFTEEEGWNSHQLWGMGIASRDIDGDGFSEVYLTSMGDQRLQALAAEETTPSFVDAPFESGTTAHRPYTGGDGRPSTGWHAAFGDVQNDGFADLFVAKGNVEQIPGSAMDDPNNLLLGTPQIMSFQEAGLEAGIATMDKSRGAVLTDLNLDGLEDLVVVNRGAAMEIYQNRTEPAGRWLQIVPGQADSNRFAIGAHVEVRAGERAWTQELTVGGGHAGGVSNGLHFGLGDAVTAEVRVVWPDGVVGDWQSVATNQRLHINRR